MKKLITMIIAFGSLMSLPVCGESIFFNGALLQTDSPPVNVGGRILVPARAILEPLGFDLTWDAEAQIVTAARGEYIIRMPIGESFAQINGDDITIDVPAQLVNNRTYLPLRFVAEASGADVGYDAVSKSATVSTAKMDKAISFRDPLLAQAVAEHFGKTDVTLRDAYYTTGMKLDRFGITTLDGLEAFVNLKQLSLSKNQLTDITKLATLKNLAELDLAGNNLQDVRILKNLRKLTTLDVRDNKLSTFTGIAQFSALENLKATNNPIKDYSSLYFMLPQLNTLDVDRDKIQIPLFNTEKTILGAGFSVPISKEIEWIPLSNVGGSRYNNSSIPTLLRQSALSKQGQLTKPYEVAQLLFWNEWFKYQPRYVTKRDFSGASWRVYPSAETILSSNSGDSNSVAIMTQYLLQRDYPETGYLVLLYDDGSFQLLNYVKTEVNEKVYNEEDDEDQVVTIPSYYTFRPASYLQQSGIKAAQETGLIDDYFESAGLLANMHKCSDLDVFSKHILASDPKALAVIQYIPSALGDKLPFAMGIQGSDIYFSNKAASKYQILATQTDKSISVSERSFDLEAVEYQDYPEFPSYMYK